MDDGKTCLSLTRENVPLRERSLSKTWRVASVALALRRGTNRCAALRFTALRFAAASAAFVHQPQVTGEPAAASLALVSLDAGKKILFDFWSNMV